MLQKKLVPFCTRLDPQLVRELKMASVSLGVPMQNVVDQAIRA